MWKKQLGEMEKTAREVCRKSDGMVRDKGTFHHHHYIKEVLLVALRYRKSKFGNNRTFQQDNGTHHTHQET